MRLTPFLIAGIVGITLAVYALVMSLNDHSKLGVVYLAAAGILGIGSLFATVTEQLIVTRLDGSQTARIWFAELIFLLVLALYFLAS